ncbi:dihydrodipicolinate synthase family protein [Mesorhizobium sp. VK4C]|uniref:dihydrodipicolinate synthase family protein n=1 Tax=Mesorhizobium captivum TaxID=3072319 RepID=UPI002A23DE53|nr:dihydrodipicolinate synthase family protein [Mesorhizobium sp. VK4C]MDX8499037.1 dihydrodipicolinate synthase family protein [Mesorhizobium sp. VK4C]
MPELRGICAALCTPMRDGGASVDIDQLRVHIDTMIEAGVDIVGVCGGTGEFPFLTTEEKRVIAESAGRHIDGRAKLIVQTSAIRTEDAIEAALHAESVGADALLVLPPFFEGPTADGVFSHYEKIASQVRVPIMVYNVPAHSGFDITPDFFNRLQEIDNVQYIKDTSGSFVRVQELLVRGANVFNGSDPFAFHALIAGAVGCFWGAVNAMPREAVELYRLVRAGETNAASKLWNQMLPANLFFWSHAYNPAIKAATNLRINPVGPCRQPVQPLSKNELRELEEALAPLL